MLHLKWNTTYTQQVVLMELENLKDPSLNIHIFQLLINNNIWFPYKYTLPHVLWNAHPAVGGDESFGVITGGITINVIKGGWL